MAVEWKQVGEIIVVKLPSEILTAEQRSSVEEQFQRLIGGHHCDFIVDFANVSRISAWFIGAIIVFEKQAQAEAEKRGKYCCPSARPIGEGFNVFNDRETALQEMARHDEHGWVVLCSVPAHIRDLFKALFGVSRE